MRTAAELSRIAFQASKSNQANAQELATQAAEAYAASQS